MTIHHFKIPLAIIAAATACLHPGGAAPTKRPITQDAPDFLQWRGVMHLNGSGIYSLHDTEAGQAYWLKPGQERGALKVIEYHSENRTLEISWNGRKHKLRLSNSSAEKIAIAGSRAPIKAWNPEELTEFNQQLLKVHSRLVKPTLSSASGRVLKNDQVVDRLRDFILTNPKPREVTDYIFPELAESIDLEEYLKLEVPRGVPNRSARDTPGWDIKDNVTFDEIAELVRSSPTENQLAAIKKSRSN